MRNTKGLIRIIAGFSGAMGVAMGAVAAHGIADAHAAEMVKMASLYQILHSAMLFFMISETGKMAALARLCFLSGIVFFCGGIYLQYVAQMLFFKGLVPFGGISFITGWLAIAAAGFKKTQ